MMETLTTEQFSAWSRAIRKSDRRSYKELFDATYSSLFRYTCYITDDPASSYDVLQEVYIRLWQIRERLDPERSLKALMYQMVRNRAFNHLRARSRLRAREIAVEHVNDKPSAALRQDQVIEFSQLQAYMQRWIMELPKRRREAFMLSRFEGLSHVEIAEVMGLTPKTVNNHIVLALSDLRNKLEAYRCEPAMSS